MADPTPRLPESPARRRRSRRRKLRRRLALLLVLFAVGVGAALLGPGLIDVGRVSHPATRPAKRPVRTSKPLVQHHWRFNFSMGPIFELIEQSLNLQPFDLRRPVRIPFPTRPPTLRGDDILLADPSRYLPPFVPGNAGPMPPLPGRQYAGGPPGLPPYTPPGSDIPNGEPDFDPDLLDGDDPPADDGIPLPDGEKKPKKKKVPEPSTALLLGSAALASLLRARRRGPS